MKRILCLCFVFFFLGCVDQSEAQRLKAEVAQLKQKLDLMAKNPFVSRKWIDLSYNFDEQTIYWPTAKGFELKTVFAGDTEKGYHYEAYNYSADEHGGTHLDAPVHFAEGANTAEKIPIGQLIGPGIVINVSSQAMENRDYQVNVEDFLTWEKENGTIPDGAIVLLYTGSGIFWPDRKKYMGTDERGEGAVSKLHFPGLHPDAAAWLVKNRKIAAIGLDTPSIDYGQSKLFGSHCTLFAANIPAFENVAQLDLIPATGSIIIALPMKIKGGSGGPLRIIAGLIDN